MSNLTAVRERPMIFSGPMIRALLSGAKTQTRRVVKPQPPEGQWIDGCHYGKTGWALWGPPDEHGRSGCNCYREVRCPYGKPGDILWCRESFRREIDDDGAAFTRYRADDDGADQWRYKPSIHMPRHASRLTLEVTEVRVERVNQISEADALAEGIPADPGDRNLVYLPTHPTYPPKPFPFSRNHPVVPTATQAFAALWDSINGKKDGCKFVEGPWCWCLTFRMMN